MDTSETYIKMCEKAAEIQQSGFAPQGSFLLHPLPEHIKVLTIWQQQYSGQYSQYDLALDQGGHYWLIPPTYSECIWLPRQDQLQAMVKSPLYSLLDNFKDFICLTEYYDGIAHTEVIDSDIVDKYPSLEQLWLVFVMKTKYNKIWDDKEWVVGSGEA